MAGAWEIKEAHKVLVGILHTDVTTLAWAFGLRNLIVPGHICPVAGMPYDMARNVVCRQALDGGFEYVFFLDSDIITPRDAILRLMAHKLPIVSGLYCRRSPPHGIPVMIRQGVWVQDYVPGSLVEVDVVGAGCLLIHRSVLEALPPSRPGSPWFDWRVNMQGMGLSQEECQSEDFMFCRNAKKIGIKTFVDTSIVCKHVGYAEATHNRFVPMETTPHT